MLTRLTLTAAILVAAAGLAEAKTRLTVNCFWPQDHFACTEILSRWIGEVARVTQGRVTGAIPGASVAPPPDQLAAVETGLADVAVQFNGLIQTRAIGALVAMQPFSATRNAEAMSKALWATNRRFFAGELDTVQLISQFVISPGELFSQTETPVNSVEDLSARRIWALPGPLSAMARRMGADVVTTPAVRSHAVIARTGTEGHLGLDPQAVRSFQLMPHTRSTTRFHQPIYATSFSVVMNKEVWARLSHRDRAAIMNVSGDVLGAAFGARWDQEAATAEASFADAGIAVVHADATFERALRAASRFVTDAWLKDAAAAGIDGAAALDFYRARMSALIR